MKVIILKKLQNYSKDEFSKPIDIFSSIGNGSVDPSKIINFLYPKLKYKISFANQSSGSKEARIRGVSLNY